MVTVREIMASNVFTVFKSTTIQAAADAMKRDGIGSLLVKENNEIIGIVTETDIVHKVVAAGMSAQTTRVDQVMSYPLMTVEAGWEIGKAGERMIENGIRHLAVTDAGHVIGLVSMRDLLTPLINRPKETGP